jgi:hydroxymethylglutaryl-CoA reductase
MIVGSAGLASNLAALRALATDGIQRGHMALHRKSQPIPVLEPPRPTAEGRGT